MAKILAALAAGRRRLRRRRVNNATGAWAAPVTSGSIGAGGRLVAKSSGVVTAKPFGSVQSDPSASASRTATQRPAAKLPAFHEFRSHHKLARHVRG